jgi:AraC-like DNA-binding protein
MVKESNYYQHLTSDKQRVVDGKDRIYYSELNQYYSANAFRNFSVKLPLKGTVNYRTDHHEYQLTPDHFLLISKQPGKVFFDNDVTVKSICIDISEATFAEAFTVLTANEEVNLENLQAGYFNSIDFFENIYTVENDMLGNALKSVVEVIKGEPANGISAETFLNLAEKIIFHQYKNFQSINGLLSAKQSTKKEILKRVLRGKEFIDEQYLQNPEIAVIAKAANLSEFHFFRSFKQALGITPYQYMLLKRLERAKKLIQSGHLIEDAAIACSFPDIFSFSKAFKKKYSHPPSFFKTRYPLRENNSV